MAKAFKTQSLTPGIPASVLPASGTGPNLPSISRLATPSCLWSGNGLAYNSERVNRSVPKGRMLISPIRLSSAELLSFAGLE
jgi:hypothetical protein